jgi:RND superfamily putative drug exporter
VIGLLTSRRGALVVVVAWIAAAVAGFFGHAELPALTAGNPASFLPRHSQSTQAVQQMGKGFPGGVDVPAMVVFARSDDGLLTAADRAAIGAYGDRVDALGLRGATPALDPLLASGQEDVLGTAGLISRDGRAALVPVGLNAEVGGAVTGGVRRLRALIARSDLPPGLEGYVTGPAGLSVDLEDAADDAGRTLLFVTTGLVLVLLLLVYRAPLLALVPLISVACAYLASAGLTYLLIKSGAITVNAEGTMLLLVLIFGAGTDYALLLVHRYRDELGRAEGPPAEALRRAVRATAPAIGAAAGTVILAMLVLLLADLDSTHWLGPVLALGIAVMLLAAFTLLPALLTLLGPRAFWPQRDLAASPPAGVWTRVAGLVRRRPRALAATIFAVLLVFAAGNLVHHGTIGFGQGASSDTNSAKGTTVLEAHFPAGLSSPMAVLVNLDRAEDALPVLRRIPRIATALPAGVNERQALALLAVIIDANPYGEEAIDIVRDIRRALRVIDPGATVAGTTAENLDVETTNARDTRVIVPVVLALMLLVLIAMLRALVAPLYLVVSIIASFAATMGVATMFLTQVVGSEGLTFDLPLMAFIFLVALGIDYTIFLMHRVRVEAAGHGTREGALRGLVATGGVVTGAGIILAGTFATLTLTPLAPLAQIGATVAFGILLDTFVVRALLVPALTVIAGERAWWPRVVARAPVR